MTYRHPEALMSEALGREPGDEFETSIRALLKAWGYRHRDFDIVAEIRADLSAMGLTTDPPFDSGPSSATVRVVPVRDVEAEQRQERPNSPLETPTATEELATQQVEDQGASEPTSTSQEPLAAAPAPSDSADGKVFPQVSLRVGDLDSATRGVTSVSPEQSLQTAHALMMKNGYSQLPVLADPGTLLGVVSWESIACAWVANSDVTLTNATRYSPEVIQVNNDLLEQLPKIVSSGFAFVRNADDRICGIVTTADLSDQFDHLARPFFIIGEIERRLRRRIDDRVPLETLRTVGGGTKVQGAKDLMFGKLVDLLSSSQRWTLLKWNVDRGVFVADLDEVRKIRNAVMHFDSEPLGPVQLDHLHRFAAWLRQLDPRP